MRTRLAVGAGGVGIGAFGVYQLLTLGVPNLVATVVWLAGGVLLHDGVLAFATIAIVGAGTLLLPQRGRGPLAAAFLVLGTVTLSAVPVLGRFGARPDNPTLLDRDYVLGWVALVVVVVIATTAAVLVRGRSSLRRNPGAK